MKIRSFLNRFAFDRKGSATLQAALLFGAVALALGVLGAPFMQGAAQYVAEHRAPAVDRLTTSSIKQKTYVVRRSVLSEDAEMLCGDDFDSNCTKNN